MAFLVSALGKQMVANSTTTLTQALTPSKNDMKILSDLIRVNTKRYWKPLVAAGAVGALVIGAHKVWTEVHEQRKGMIIAPNKDEAESLSYIAGTVAKRVNFYSNLSTMDELADSFLEEIEEELELEDCLENDPIPTEDIRWSDVDLEIEILELKDELNKGLDTVIVSEMVIDAENENLEDLKPNTNSVGHAIRRSIAVKSTATPTSSLSLLKQKLIVKESDYHKKQMKRQRKRVIHGKLSSAIKGLTNKIRVSFPIPDGTQLQQKAMSLYAAKECRKMNMRESAVAELVPKAVSLASIPTTAQVDLRMITKIEPVQLKYQKMAWSGYKNKSTWLAKLASSFA